MTTGSNGNPWGFVTYTDAQTISGVTGPTGPSGSAGATGPTGGGAPVTAPGTSSSTGVAGQWAYDATHIYVCIATNTWCRATIATF